jgi:outer membrane protein assembly factor BamD
MSFAIRNYRGWLIPAALFIAFTAGCAGHRPPPPNDEALFMDWARTAYKERDYNDLVLSLKEYLPRHAGSRYTEEATLLLGKALYEQDLYVEAEEQFKNLLHDFPGGEYAPEATYHLGLAYLAQSRPPQLDQRETIDALVQFQSFVNRYPDHSLVESAKKHILDIRNKLATKYYLAGKLYAKRGGNWHRAARFYFKDKVLGEYGDTKVASLAALGLAESYNTTHEWQKLADTCKLLLDRYPHSNEAYRAKDLLKKAQKNGATLSLVGTPAPADTTGPH